ncbi:unnamed protein product [Caenorhabditis bovis]|uniref:Uncharacterized protein n=1 Tax=Caenorhabditis bovis TaxID=2654633 RepID=A0A8S1EIG1_9PELO|nr:unnamed protein product [Caenorhabditis bovis]
MLYAPFLKNQNSTLTDEAVENSITLFTATFALFIPYLFLVMFFYMARKTDNRQPHYIIQLHFVGCGSLCFLGTFLFAILLLVFQSSNLFGTAFENFYFINFLCTLIFKLVISSPVLISTIFYHLLFVTSLQRLILISNAKVGMQLLTGRRLGLKIAILYLIALISGISKLIHMTKPQYLEVVMLMVTICLFGISYFFIRHIERRLIASAHTTVLRQTVPIVAIQSLFTLIELYAIQSQKPTSIIYCVRTIETFSLSFLGPLIMILGSRSKCRIVWAIATCRWDENYGRGELYTSNQTPMDISNAVSLSPTPTNRF